MGKSYEQYCPIAKGAELLGERWSILVIRELLAGSRSFNDIARGVPRMSRTMLSKRLRQLQGSGLVERLDSSYVPTTACEELRPVLLGLGHWAATWIMQDPSEDDCDVDLLMWWAHSRFNVASLPTDQRTVVMFHFVDVNERYWTVVERGTCSICLSDPGFETDAFVKTDAPTMFKVWNGREPIEHAIRAGRIRFEGSTTITRRLPDVLRLDPATGLLGPGGTAPARRLLS
jgi:DNA-binding HxlR family transcriptional regulator